MEMLLFCILLMKLYSSAIAQVGTSCKVEYSGVSGTCKLGSDCLLAQKLANDGIRPTICGYGFNREPIVCCEGTVQANENSFLNLDVPSNNPDGGFIYPDDTTENTISERKCTEYSKPISGEVQILPLIAGAVPTSINITKCDYDGVALIVGGTPAQLGEFPFMAAVGFRNENDEILWLCGGTLISERYVMTAAHCSGSASFGSPVKVRLGDLDLGKTDDGTNPQDFDVEKIIVHPNYKRAMKYNDIALIKLSKTVQKFTKLIRPACLFNHFNVPQNTAIATGWGQIDQGAERSDRLLKVALTIFPNSKCQKTYNNVRGLANGVVDSMLCAGESKERRDTCHGDSGGPLLITKAENQCVFYVVGITSFGKLCAEPGIPAIYTRVSQFIPWIEKTIW